jgi:hydroxymethylpyrimidine pyrophosphatase-like HAD family hydrolase
MSCATIGLVATDLDGTLLRDDKTISPRTVATLRRLTSAGIHFVLVTGRPVRWLARVYGQLGLQVPAICANGAVVYDPEADEILRTDPLAPERLAEVCRRLRAEIPGVRFAVEIADSREMRHEQAYAFRGEPDPHVRVLGSPDELYAVPAVKLLVRGEDPGEDPGDGRPDTGIFAARVAACVTGLAEATHSTDAGLVEISAAGITKAAGLAWLSERLGVRADDVVAFGDMPNDLPMLAWAGRSVAVANAHSSVRAAADDIAGSNEDDGVAAYLDRLVG